MISFENSRQVAFLLVAYSVSFSRVLIAAQEESPNEDLVQAIVEFAKAPDHNTRALAMQQIRDEIPGEAATKQFATLLNDLPSDAQAELLDALGERGDRAAKDAVVGMLENSHEAVASAALRALGKLGSPSDIDVLLAKTTDDRAMIRQAAQQSLTRMRGEGVNTAIVSQMDHSNKSQKTAILEILAARNATDSIPQVLACAADDTASVRIAAISALRLLAREDNTSDLVGLVRKADNEQERRIAELALLSLCHRSRDACTDAVIEGLETASPTAQVVLLRVVARIGGSTALKAVVARLSSEDDAVHAEALRLLSVWPTAEAFEPLLQIAKSSETTRDRVLALRGVVRSIRLAETTADSVEILTSALAVAKRPQDQKLIIGRASGIASPLTLELLLPFLRNPEVANEAALAITRIAEHLPEQEDASGRTALVQVKERINTPSIRQRAQELLEKPQ